MSENIIPQNKPAVSSVLITGGSGLIGRYLTSALLSEGYKVSHLSRNTNQFGRIRVFRWDPEKGILDPLALEGVGYIIHLAGANIGEKRWTKKRKQEIESSRIDSAKLLYRVISENNIPIEAFITASAVGYYGLVTTDRIYNENDHSADDFLGSVCRKWEEAADLFSTSGIRVVKIRTGVVMEKNDSALAKLLIPARMGIFPRLGSGRQHMPWIHIQDLCSIYLKFLRDDKMAGAYNAVSSQHINQTEFMRTLAKTMNKSFFHPTVPSVFMKIALGEMSDVVLKGSRVSCEKILSSGYIFKYPMLEGALINSLS